jgi:type I restriction-modification system DNA methylase subunit
VLANQKPVHRKGKVQLIDATQWFKPLRKNLGKKNCELSPEDIDRVCDYIGRRVHELLVGPRPAQWLGSQLRNSHCGAAGPDGTGQLGNFALRRPCRVTH